MTEENQANIIIVREPVDISTVQKAAERWYGNMVKGVADTERGIIALGGEWHMDANNVLIADGSKQEHNWGFNIYPDERGDAAIEYISLINIRPAQNNRSMEVESKEVKGRMRAIISQYIPDLEL